MASRLTKKTKRTQQHDAKPKFVSICRNIDYLMKYFVCVQLVHDILAFISSGKGVTFLRFSEFEIRQLNILQRNGKGKARSLYLHPRSEGHEKRTAKIGPGQQPTLMHSHAEDSFRNLLIVTEDGHAYKPGNLWERTNPVLDRMINQQIFPENETI
uniref:Uncharacterized protein n=1 Tax=Glossina pallidipes TaxID=7398 RepID=A0A1A9ZIM4_GLOPL